MRGLALILVFAFIMVDPVEACEEPEPEFGCKPWVTCMPVDGGWKWIRR